MNEETIFPAWGFWIQRDTIYGSVNVTHKVHLFLSKEKTACGYSPIIPEFHSFFRWRYSNEPKLGFWGVAFEVSHKRPATIDDFKKCKRCLKRRTKE